MLDKYKKTVDTGLARSASRSIPRTWNAMCSSSCNEETSYRIAFGHFRSTVHVLCLSIGDPTYQKKIECSRRRKNRNQCPMRAMWSLPVLDLSIGKYNVLAYISGRGKEADEYLVVGRSLLRNLRQHCLQPFRPRKVHSGRYCT